MLISRLLRSLLRFLAMGIVPDEGGGAAPAPAVDVSPPAVDPPAAPEPAPPSAPADPFAGLKTALDTIGGDAADPSQAGQPRDAMGRFLPIDPNAAPVPLALVQPPAAQAPVAPVAPVPPAPKPGDIDLTPPDGMTDRAQARWAQLTERVKQVPELERRATEAATALDNVRRMVSDSGLAQDEFSDMLQMASLFKSNDPRSMQEALQQLDGLRADLAQRMGVEVAGVDLLAGHQDLKQKVDGMLLTREDALEIARLRGKGQQADQLTAEQREQQQHHQAIQQAAGSMEAALHKRAGTPGHEAKLKYIHGHFANPANLQSFVKTYQPQQWEAVLMTMYDAFTPQAPAQPPTPQPLRPGALRPGAQVQTGPVTAESAVSGAFDRLGL